MRNEHYTTFVANLPYDLGQKEIADHASKYGAVTGVHVPLDYETQRPKGIAFVRSPSQADRDNIITGLNGDVLGGRVLHASIAQPRGFGI
jgi:cold-inducible RNA-binding protein